MSSSPEDNNDKLLNIVKELTFKLESTSRIEKQFRNQVRDKINNFIPPIRQAGNYISELKDRIKNLEQQLADLENDLDDDLDGENAETIRKAREKLNEFTSYIENTNELDSSLNNLGNAIDDLQKLSGEKMKKEGGGRRKLRKTRKKRKAKRSNKIKYH